MPGLREMALTSPSSVHHLRSIDVSEASDGSYESSIYSAARTSSLFGDSTQRIDVSLQRNGVLDDRMVANMARLIRLSSAYSTSCLSAQSHYVFRTPRTKSFRWHPYLLSSTCPRHRSQHYGTTRPYTFIHRRRRALSFDDVDSTTRKPRPLGNLMSPVSPVQPQYPPPVRQPTPPGVPSFGTREAMLYSVQLLDSSFMTESQGRQIGTEQGSGATYGEAFRRLIGIPPPPSSLQRGSWARAPDGTVVFGHFPYRHSGHGTNAAGRLDTHPFHRRNLPSAPVYRAHGDTTAECGKQVGPMRPVPGQRSSSLSDARQLQSQTVPSIHGHLVRVSMRESYHTCTGEPQGLEDSRNRNRAEIPPSIQEADNPPVAPLVQPSSPVSTASLKQGAMTDPPTHALTQISEVFETCLSCCLIVGDYDNEGNGSRTGSNDTYATAQSHISNQSTEGHTSANAGASNPAHTFEGQCAKIWKSIKQFAARSLLTMEPMLA